MTKPEEFSLTTDYATLKNDAVDTFTLTLPAVTVPASGNLTVTATKTVGTSGASERAQIHSSKLGRRYSGSILVVNRKGTTFSSGAGNANYSVIADLSRTSNTQLTATVTIRNPYTESLLPEPGDETFTFSVATFIPPFA